MSLSQKIKSYGNFAMRLVRRGESGAAGTEHVLVLEQAGRNAWKVIEAKLEATGITVLSARSFEEGLAGSASEMLGNLNNSTVTLVPDSGKSVCRLLEIPDASPDELKRMVALRLEVELPYPVADSVWMYEPRTNSEGTISNVLVIATASSEIASAESELRKGGLRGAAMEFAAGGLAELANVSGASNGTTAVAKVDDDVAILAIAHDTALCYARHIRLRPPAKEDGAPADEWVTLLAQELRQSIYDYTLRTGNAAPDHLMVTGERMKDEGFVETLKARLEIPVIPIDCPGMFHLSDPESIEGDLLADYPVLVGVLISMRRRMLGQPTAAPLFRQRRRDFWAMDWGNRRFQLFGLNAVLLLLFIASLFGVQSLRLDSADRLIGESQPLLQSLELQREEVDILQYENRRRRSVLDVMMALSEALPQEITVETLAIDSRGKISISGKAKSVEIASDTAIAALRASTIFINAQFNGATREKEEFSFQMTCELRGGGRGIRK